MVPSRNLSTHSANTLNFCALISPTFSLSTQTWSVSWFWVSILLLLSIVLADTHVSRINILFTYIFELYVKVVMLYLSFGDLFFAQQSVLEIHSCRCIQFIHSHYCIIHLCINTNTVFIFMLMDIRVISFFLSAKISEAIISMECPLYMRHCFRLWVYLSEQKRHSYWTYILVGKHRQIKVNYMIC